MAHLGEGRSDEPYPRLRDLGIGIAYAFIALLISGGVLGSMYLLLSPELGEQRAATDDGSARPWRVSGSSLIARRGSGEETESGGMRITQLEEGPRDTRSIYTRRVGFKAADYPYLQYRVTGQNPASFYYFIWRTADKPGETSHVALARINDMAQVSMLSNNPHWRGTITEVGIDVYGELRGDAQTIESLDMLPPSNWNFIRAIWSEWAGLETWNQRSAHHLMGGPYQTILPRPLAMAIWAIGALALLILARVFAGSDIRIAVLLAVLTPWLVIDMLWQRNLSAQLAETRYVFAGKTQQEKHHSDLDGVLYDYAQRLKNEVLPEPGVKIFLLNDSPWRDYHRLKMQFYLLPHNIFNFGKFPRPESLQPGDYLLAMGDIPGLNYDASTATLNWRDQTLRVIEIDKQGLGSLYQYAGTP